jgi:hypothetical protein
MELVTTENKSNIAKAIIEVMKELEAGIDKSMTVGTGQNAYKAMADVDVKKFVRKAMIANGLCILQTGITKKTTISNWDEVDSYSNQTPKATKRKQNVFTEVVPQYTLLHTSGESIILYSLGQGVDPQDKGAGKATTYALKNLLLYTFLIPSEKIDDTDNQHSDDIKQPKTPPAQQAPAAPPKKPKPPKTIDAEGLKKILASDLVGLNATIKGITDKKVIATAEQVLQIQNKIIELTPKPTAEEPEIPWITTDQINKALESPIKQLKSTINVIKKGKMKARAEDLKLLEDKVLELEPVTK